MQKWITNPIFDRKMRSKQERVSRMFDLRPQRNMLSGDLERSGRGYAQILWAMLFNLVPMTLFDTGSEREVRRQSGDAGKCQKS